MDEKYHRYAEVRDEYLENQTLDEEIRVWFNKHVNLDDEIILDVRQNNDGKITSYRRNL